MAASNANALAVVSQSQQIETYAPVDYTREQVELIKDSFAKGATDAELSLFVEIAKRKGLDIFSKQICLVPRWDSRLKREVKDPQTTIDGYRLIAERTGRYVPGRDTVYQYDNGLLLSATAYVKKLVANEWHEIAATAFFDEYVQRNREGAPNAVWLKMPHVMIAKCAESLALRKAFPAELSGIYTQDEMASANESERSVSPRQSVEALSQRITKVDGGYDCDENGELHSIRKENGRIICTCSERDDCLHRVALKLFIAREKALVAVEEPETAIDTPQFQNPEHAAAFEMQAPSEPAGDEHIITKSQLIALADLCKEMEAAGITEETWRDYLERITGQRTRKGLLQADLAKIMHSFRQALSAAEKRSASKGSQK